MNLFVTVLRKECREDVIAVRGMGLYLAAALVLSGFGLLLVGNTELSLLDNAQAVYMMEGIVLALAVLVAVVGGSDGFAGERDRQTLEALLVTPLSGRILASGKLASLVVSWLILYCLALPYVWAVGSSGQNLLPALGYLFVAGNILVVIFGGLVFSLSAKIKSFKGAISAALVLFLLAAAPVALGPSLRQSAVGRLLDWLNPFAIAMNMLDAVVIDSQTAIGQQVVPLLLLLVFAMVAAAVLFLATRRIEL